MYLVILPDAGAISTSAEFLLMHVMLEILKLVILCPHTLVHSVDKQSYGVIEATFT